MNIKGPYCDPLLKSILEKTNLDKNSSTSPILIKSRSSTILPEFVGIYFAVHNGKEYKTFGIITPEHVGKKFGEFSPTKKPAIYKKKK